MATSSPPQAGPYKRQPSVDEVLELTAKKTAPSDAGRDELQHAAEEGLTGAEEGFKTYRRRWAYLAVLVLMNISISWGVSFTGYHATYCKPYS
jgi:hypothetical protein